MNPISNLIIFYFSGTGNSAKVVEWITNIAQEKGTKVKSFNLSKIERSRSSLKLLPIPNSNPYYLFVAPTHGFNYPPIMMHFLPRFPKGSNQVGLINTRAGMRIGKVITPGLSGLALLFGATVLRMKGYSIRAMIPVDLPSNWVSIHPAIRQKGVRIIHRKNKERVTKFTEKLLAGKRNLKGLRDIIQDLVISPISIAYYFIGRFVLSKTFFASPACTNCGLCEKNCGVKAIKTKQGRPFWTHKCESCMHCMSYCPENAIQTGHGFIIGLSILFTSFLMGRIYSLLEGNLFEINNHILRFIISNGLYILYIFLAYKIVHYFMRYKWFGRLLEFTSLTSYKFWGKGYKALKDEEF